MFRVLTSPHAAIPVIVRTIAKEGPFRQPVVFVWRPAPLTQHLAGCANEQAERQGPRDRQILAANGRLVSPIQDACNEQKSASGPTVHRQF